MRVTLAGPISQTSRAITRINVLAVVTALLLSACNRARESESPAQPRLVKTDGDACKVDSKGGSVPPQAPPPGIVVCKGAVPGGSPLIDDFEDGDPFTPVVDHPNGTWFTYTDQTAGCLEARVAPADGGQALRISGRGFTAWGAGFGTALSWSAADQKICLYDATAYGGLRFRARGNATLRVSFQTEDTTLKSRGGLCPDSENCYDRHGRTIVLGPNWQEYELDFCDLAPEGWGGQKPSFDPSTLVTLNIQVQSWNAFDLWLDDVALTKRSKPAGGSCGPVCPTDELPLGVQPKPEQTTSEPSSSGSGPGIKLYTFQQETPSCGPLSRRYLAYLPKGVPSIDDTPVLIVLHGTGGDAESMRNFMTKRSFERLADRDGFVVVYGNAAPGAATSASMPNGGAWRDTGAGEVDDHDYLVQVIEDLRRRSILTRKSPVFLAGLSNGGGMVLSAALKAPDRYRGIAALMPYAGETPALPPAELPWATQRVLIAYAHGDPGMPPDYNRVIEPLPGAWATALGLTAAESNHPVRTSLPDRILEGRNYVGDLANALKTRGSRASRIDYRGPTSSAAVRVFEFDRAGHFWPVFEHNDPPEVLARWGYRNQDIDVAEAIWEFFATAR